MLYVILKQGTVCALKSCCLYFMQFLADVRCPSFTHSFLVHSWIPEDKKRAGFVAHHPYAESVASLVVYMAKQFPSTNHTMFCDNYFTSARAFRSMYDMGMHAIGTLKGKSDVPAAFLWPKRDASRPVGSARFLRSTDSDRKLVVQEWQDGGLVRVMSTCHVGVAGKPGRYDAQPGVTSVTRWRHAGLAWQSSATPCPPAVRAYQVAMGGVDRSDQVGIPVAVHGTCVNVVFVCVQRHAAYTCRLRSVR
jgi:hypothetical protein